MKMFIVLAAVAAVASAGLIPATTVVRAPAFDSAVIKSDRLGGNFAYSTAENHAYAAVSPVVQHVATPVAVSYSAPAVAYAHAPVAYAPIAHAAPAVAYAHPNYVVAAHSPIVAAGPAPFVVSGVPALAAAAPAPIEDAVPAASAPAPVAEVAPAAAEPAPAAPVADSSDTVSVESA